MPGMSSNREIIATLYRHFENKDMAAASEIVAEDIVMDFPYSPDGYPKRLIGKKDFTHHMASGLAAYAKVKFINMRFWDMADPGLISVQLQGETELTSIRSSRARSRRPAAPHRTAGRHRRRCRVSCLRWRALGHRPKHRRGRRDVLISQRWPRGQVRR